MQKWRADGVPLPVVIEAIDQVFENNETSGRRKTISSLSYCRHAVKELWDERKELYVGGDSVVPERGAETSLEELATELEQASAPPDVVRSVRELSREKSVPKIEEKLMAIETELLDAAAGTLSAGELASLRQNILDALGDMSRLKESTRLRTEEAARRRMLRERFGYPRLTLFR